MTIRVIRRAFGAMSEYVVTRPPSQWDRERAVKTASEVSGHRLTEVVAVAFGLRNPNTASVKFEDGSKVNILL